MFATKIAPASTCKSPCVLCVTARKIWFQTSNTGRFSGYTKIGGNCQVNIVFVFPCSSLLVPCTCNNGMGSSLCMIWSMAGHNWFIGFYCEAHRQYMKHQKELMNGKTTDPIDSPSTLHYKAFTFRHKGFIQILTLIKLKMFHSRIIFPSAVWLFAPHRETVITVWSRKSHSTANGTQAASLAVHKNVPKFKTL